MNKFFQFLTVLGLAFALLTISQERSFAVVAVENFQVTLTSIAPVTVKGNTYTLIYEVANNSTGEMYGASRYCYLTSQSTSNPSNNPLIKPVSARGYADYLPSQVEYALGFDSGILGSTYAMFFDPGLPLFYPTMGLGNKAQYFVEYTAEANTSHNEVANVYVMCTIDYGTDENFQTKDYQSNVVTTRFEDPCYGKTCGCGSLPACPVNPPTPTPTNPAPTNPAPSAPVQNNPTVATNNSADKVGSNADENSEFDKYEFENFFGKSSEDKKKIKNFTVVYDSQNSIEYLVEVDFSTIKDMEEFVKIFQITEEGKISIDSEKYPFANKPAKIIMKGLSFKFTPVILRNGEDASDYVSDIQYDSEKGELTFTVKGFSTYEAVASEEENLTNNSAKTTENSGTENVINFLITNWYIPAACLLLISIVVSVLIILGIQNRKKSKA